MDSSIAPPMTLWSVMAAPMFSSRSFFAIASGFVAQSCEYAVWTCMSTSVYSFLSVARSGSKGVTTLFIMPCS